MGTRGLAPRCDSNPGTADTAVRPICVHGFKRKMAYEILSSDDAVICVRISDSMRYSDQTALQAATAELIAQRRKIRLLVRLENFQGWERDKRWDDVGFLMRHGDDIEKMAIVGDVRWKDDALVFVGKGFRATEIEFFAPESLSQAEVWVRI